MQALVIHNTNINNKYQKKNLFTSFVVNNAPRLA